MFITVDVSERAVLHVNGVPEKWLGPGRHLVVRPFSKVQVVRFKLDHLAINLRPEEAVLAPTHEVTTVDVPMQERVVVFVAGHPVRWLGMGRHYLFTVDPTLRMQRLDASTVEAKPLEFALRALAPEGDYVEATVPAGHAALRYVDGEVDQVLAPGRHAAWRTLKAVNLAVIDLRERLLSITGQDVMSKDRVSLRLNISVVFQVADPLRMATTASNAEEALYLAVQLAVRDAVTSRTLDGLLASRDALATELFESVAPRAEALGLRLKSLGLKDVVLPGEIRELMNKVVEAQKAAEANVITRREETAATRSLAQTAQLLVEQPLLIRLKELEAYKDLAERVGTINVVMGQDALPMLQLKS